MNGLNMTKSFMLTPKAIVNTLLVNLTISRKQCQVFDMPVFGRHEKCMDDENIPTNYHLPAILNLTPYFLTGRQRERKRRRPAPFA
jgi:hypothetical protein